MFCALTHHNQCSAFQRFAPLLNESTITISSISVVWRTWATFYVKMNSARPQNVRDTFLLFSKVFSLVCICDNPDHAAQFIQVQIIEVRLFHFHTIITKLLASWMTMSMLSFFEELSWAVLIVPNTTFPHDSNTVANKLASVG